MFRLGRSRALALALFLMSGLLVAAADPSAGGLALLQKEKDKDKKDDKEKDKDKKDFKGKDKKDAPGKEGKEAPGKAIKDLRKAYEIISDLSQGPNEGRESGRMLDYAKRFYREAVKAYPDDPRRAADLAAAANDAARGLEQLRRASIKPVAGLPEPPTEAVGPPGGPLGGPKGKGPAPKGPPQLNAPQDAEPGPWSESLQSLSVTRDRLSGLDTTTAVNGPSRDVIEAAKATYDQARKAYESGDYRKAGYLARAAEAWSRIPEHLVRGGLEAAGPLPVGPIPKARGSGAPPPPPPIKN